MSKINNERRTTKKFFDYNFKAVILGDSSVGKTSILHRYCKNKFENVCGTTIGVDFQKKSIVYNDKKIELQIWDTAGQEKYRAMTKIYYKNASGIILAFDLTCKKTFSDTQIWLDDIKKEVNNNLPIILVGNKFDLENKEVTNEEIEEFSKNFNLTYYDTSALTGQNINEIFLKLTEKMVKFIDEGRVTKENINKLKISIDSNIYGKDKKKNKCC